MVMMEMSIQRGASFKTHGFDAYKPAILAARNGSPQMMNLVIGKCKTMKRDPNKWSGFRYHRHVSNVEKPLASLTDQGNH